MAIEVNALDGQEVSGATLRLANFQGTSGGNGVILPADLRVRALDVPGAAVQVIRGPSGGASLVNTAAGAQAYVTHATETEQVPVPATDSSGSKTRYIIQYIDTLNTPGAHYACVDSLTPYANVPHIVLARINQPASTATITADLITDLREIANPREKLERVARPNVTADTGMVLNATGQDGEWFPNSGGDQDIPIPSWAVYAQITATWVNIRYEANVNPYGQYWVEYGPYARPSTRERSTQRFQFNHFPTSGTSGDSWPFGDTVYIPSAYRGTTQKFVMKARYSGADKGVSMNALSGIILDVRFVETVDQVD